MRSVIRGGRVIDPARGIDAVLDLAIENGKVAGYDLPPREDDCVVDASGKTVCPGFIDIHAHEDPMENGRPVPDEQGANLACLLRQGVTTALVGNCGDNYVDPVRLLENADTVGNYVNLAVLAGYTYFRERNSSADRYSAAAEPERERIAQEIAGALKAGCAGVSFGLEYVPGMTREELFCAARECAPAGKLVAAHIRSCAEEALPAAEEILSLGKELGIPVQISHVGSMAGYGQMEELLHRVDEYRANGLDARCDCYPYDAFSTFIGSAPYDDLAAICCSYEDIEMAEGKFRGQRCTREIFEAERRDHPGYLTVGHVMREEEIVLAYRHPDMLVGSDCFLSRGQGHPRAAGAFPRFLSQYRKKAGLSLYEAVRRVTALPAERLGLAGKGNLAPGSDADIVIFDPETLCDRATFAEPTLPPEGICRVLIRGETAVENGRIRNAHLGRAVRSLN